MVFWFRLKLLITVLILIISLIPITFIDKLSFYTFVRIDYIYWITFLLAIIVFKQVYMMCMNKPVFSTAAMVLTGFAFIIISRVLSITMSVLENPYLFYIGGFVTSLNAFKYSYPLMVFGSILFSLTNILHYHRGVVVFKTSITFGEALSILSRKVNAFKLKLFLIIGFILGLITRLLPEIHLWPRPIGYDTIMYIAHLRDFVVSPRFFSAYVWGGSLLRNIPPLLDWLTYPFALYIDPWYIFKLYPPVLYGVLIGILSILYYRVIGGETKWVLLGLILSIFNLLLLRMTWDLHKQFLATVLFLVAVVVLDTCRAKYRYYVAAIFLILSALASEFGVLYAILSSLLTLYNNLFMNIESTRISDVLKRKWKIILTYIIVIIISYSLISWYVRKPFRVNPVTGISPFAVGKISEPLGQPLSYSIVGVGILSSLFAISFRDYCRKAWHASYLALLLLIYAFTSWLIPYTEFTAAEYDRILMTASCFILPGALLAIKRIDIHVLSIPLILMLILPGIYMSLHPSLHVYNRPLIYSLKRMPDYLLPAPHRPHTFDSLLDISQYASKLYSRENDAVFITNNYYMRFLHLEIRNPDVSRLLSTGWQLNPDLILSVALRRGIDKFILLYPRTTVKTLEDDFNIFINSTKSSDKQFSSILNNVEYVSVESIYCNNQFCLYNITIHKSK